MNRLYAALICLLISLVSFTKHEFYVSITDVTIKEDTLQMAIKVFTHDLEEVIKDETGKTIFLENNNEMEKAFRVIKEYCNKHLNISNAGKSYDVKWIGHEYEADVTWIYAYAIMDTKTSLLFFRNTLLTTDNRNQHNMIHLNHKGETISKICTAQDPEVRFTIE